MYVGSTVGLTMGSHCRFFLIFAALWILSACTEPFHVETRTDSSICASDLIDEYKRLVTPVVQKNNCASCHSSGGMASNTSFKADRSLSTEEQMNSALGLIDKSSPTSSPLLRKPSGGLSHGGGKIFEEGSQEYQDLKAFIELASEEDRCASVKNCLPTKEIQRKKLRRLTQKQMMNTIDAAFGVASTLVPDLGDSQPTIGLNNDPNVLSINEMKYKIWADATKTIVDEVISSSNALAVTQCANEYSPTCFESILVDTGLKLWRRPLTSEEITTVTEAINSIAGASGAQKIGTMLQALLLSPHFLYRTEAGGTSTNGVVQLNDYEIASFLSFSLWNSPPDEQLYKKIRAGEFKTEKQIKDEAMRMLNDPRSSQGLSDFYADLLKLNTALTVSKENNPEYDGFNFDLTSNERRQLVASAEQMLSSSISADKDLGAPFTHRVFAVNSSTARFFNISQNDTSSNFQNMSFPAQERYGILSHPAFLLAHSGDKKSGIVHRGVFTLEQFLCNHIPAPPDDVSSVDEASLVLDESQISTRELLHIKHSGQGRCISCHASIDNVGGGFENFNRFGQFRIFEKQNVAIDSSGSIDGVPGANISYTNSTDMFQKMVHSERFRSCLQQKYFEYLMGETVSAENSCTINNVSARLPASSFTPRTFIQTLLDQTFTFARKEE